MEIEISTKRLNLDTNVFSSITQNWMLMDVVFLKRQKINSNYSNHVILIPRKCVEFKLKIQKSM